MSPAKTPEGPIARLRPGGRATKVPSRRSRILTPGGTSTQQAVMRRGIREWHRLSELERTVAWRDLVEWVTWLSDRYEMSREDRIPACWVEHPGLIEELAALKAWREEIYAEPAATPAAPAGTGGGQSRLGVGQGVERGQAARYWHAEMRLVVQAAMTFYAQGCRIEHRGATKVAATNTDLQARWLAANPLTAVPAALVARAVKEREAATASTPGGIDQDVMREALDEGRAQPLGPFILDYLSYAGAWWHLPSTSTSATSTSVTSTVDAYGVMRNRRARAKAGQNRARWQKVSDEAFVVRLELAKPRLANADHAAARAAQRRLESRGGHVRQSDDRTSSE